MDERLQKGIELDSVSVANIVGGSKLYKQKQDDSDFLDWDEMNTI